MTDYGKDGMETAKSRRRMAHLVPRTLLPMIGKDGGSVCSIGCGAAFDVALLVEHGIDAWGFDPGPRAESWEVHSQEVRGRLARAWPQDFPFGKERFDFAYALEVFEHVGCRNGGWELESDWWEQRVEFLRASLAMLKSGGRLFIATSNRAFPADIKHRHNYSRLQRLTRVFVNPWHPQNFLPSLGQIRRMLAELPVEIAGVRQLPTANYPSNAGNQASPPAAATLRALLTLFSQRPLLRFNPILLVMIELKQDVRDQR